METKQNMGSPLNDSDQISKNTLISRDDDIEGYLQWMNGKNIT